MFGSIDKSKGLLFVTHDLDHSLRSTIQKMQQEVEALDENRLLNTAPDDLKRYLVEKHSRRSALGLPVRCATKLRGTGGCTRTGARCVP